MVGLGRVVVSLLGLVARNTILHSRSVLTVLHRCTR
jgi:hypothetical protein